MGGSVEGAPKGMDDVQSNIGMFSDTASEISEVSEAILTATGDLADQFTVLRDKIDQFVNQAHDLV